MHIHHDKHHQDYTNKVNKALEGTEYADKPIDEVLANVNVLPEDIRTAVRNNGGGFANHSLFWTVLSPDGGGKPTGAVADAINEEFGSFEDFKQKFKSTATGQFGSGWGWLCVKDDGSLTLISTPNQDSPIMQGLTPILGLDVWEHAYYLNYQNNRGAYADAFWNLVNWDQVNQYYEEAR
jgi:Fe-Mn family superoxide dismutase